MNNKTSKSLLYFSEITKSFFFKATRKDILKKNSFQFVQGVSYALTGASGSGKSTLLYMIAGLDFPTEGTIFFNEKNVLLLQSEERALFLPLVMQTPYCIMALSAIENVIIAGIIGGKEWKASTERAHFLIEGLELHNEKMWPVGALSGGQRQRLALARALMNKPHFLLVDELTGNLDDITAQHNVAFLRELQKKEQFGLVMVTHSVAVAQCMDVMIEIKEGVLLSKK